MAATRRACLSAHARCPRRGDVCPLFVASAGAHEGGQDDVALTGMSGCTASSGPAPSSTTTWSCCAHKPGGLEHSVALAQERDRGAWPDCFDQLWAGLTDRYGRSDAARQMVDVLLLCRDHGAAGVELAVRGALTAGAIDGRAVRGARPAAPTAPGEPRPNR